MRRLGCYLIAFVAVGACTTSAGSDTSHDSSAPSQPQITATRDGTGCGSTTIASGAAPSWTDPARPPTFLRHVVSNERNAAGFLFADPLRAGERNKILWIVRQPRNGEPLHITATPTRAEAPTVRVTAPANSGPGEIYPSIVNMPRAGCWHLVLNWNGNEATFDLPYMARSTATTS